jgi:hypothetical protein
MMMKQTQKEQADLVQQVANMDKEVQEVHEVCVKVGILGLLEGGMEFHKLLPLLENLANSVYEEFKNGETSFASRFNTQYKEEK